MIVSYITFLIAHANTWLEVDVLEMGKQSEFITKTWRYLLDQDFSWAVLFSALGQSVSPQEAKKYEEMSFKLWEYEYIYV